MKASPRLGAVLAAILAAAAVLGAVSCTTTEKMLRAVSDPQVKVQAEGVTYTLLFRDEEYLARQFRKEANPFLTEYYRVSFRRIVVFELSIENAGASPVELEQKDCVLQFGGKELSPTNAFQLQNYWEATDDDPRITSMRKPLIRRHVLPNIVKVAPGSSVSGFMVFMGNLPAHGEAAVLLPGPDAADTLEFLYQF